MLLSAEKLTELKLGKTQESFMPNRHLLTPKQRAVYNYLREETVSDEYTQMLHSRVEHLRHSREWRRDYMTFGMLVEEERQEAMEQGLERGLEQGLEQGALFTSLKFLYKGLISKEEVMKELAIDEAALEEYMKEYPKDMLLK